MKILKFKFNFYTVLLFCAIFFSHDTLMFGINSSEICIAIRKIIPFILFLVLAIEFMRNLTLKKKDLIALISLIVLLIVSCLVNDEEIDNYIYRLLIIIDGFLFAILDNMIMLKYNTIMYFLSIYSLVFFSITNVLKNITLQLPQISTYIGQIYTHAIFFVSPIYGSTLYSFTRNHGIFREPGVFMLLLIIALLYELSKDIPDKKKIAIFSITILSTASTAGLIILTSIYMLIIIKNKDNQYKKIGLAVLALISITAIFYFGDISFAGKFTYGSDSYGSFYARFSSVITNIKIAIENPFFGCGRYNLYNTVLNSDFFYKAMDNTNTILICYAAFGIPFGFICTYGIYKFISLNEKNNILVFKFIILIAALSNEDIGQNILFYIMVFLGIHYQNVDFKKKTIE